MKLLIKAFRTVIKGVMRSAGRLNEGMVFACLLEKIRAVTTLIDNVAGTI